MAVTIYHEQDVDPRIIQGRKVAVIGYGSQGHAHALNLQGLGRATCASACAKARASWQKAEEAGLRVMTVAEAAEEADFVMMLVPDENQAAMYEAARRPAPEGGGRARVRARLQRPLTATSSRRRSSTW